MTNRSFHIPVMAEAVVAFLAAAPAGLLVDATAGGGGHLFALAEATTPDHLVVGVDQDPDALAEVGSRLEGRPDLRERVRLLKGNFGDLEELLEEAELGEAPPVTGILADLGVSSWQLDEPSRGFAIKHRKSALDMRMNPEEGTSSALDLLRSWDRSELANVLRSYGELKDASRVARQIKEAVDEDLVQTTGDLSDIVVSARRTPPRPGRVHPATTVFQALRIAVNRELDALETLLESSTRILDPGGRLAVISYHSLEDRMVKRAFRDGSQPPPGPRELPPPPDWKPTWEVLTRRPVTASPEEEARNPRSRSAKLRVAARAASGVGGRV
ncbi:MAG: 16S rRNA (cytosine(1402)-N(4))-methyltransferase RsmH [Myxococcota bacterium]|nr:16S rRNA (cytosine(1402)-N(4))-methyltransferase RsmH [Myxococcota bacterium]